MVKNPAANAPCVLPPRHKHLQSSCLSFGTEESIATCWGGCVSHGVAAQLWKPGWNSGLSSGSDCMAMRLGHSNYTYRTRAFICEIPTANS